MDVESKRRIIGFETEMKVATEWLNDSESETEILYISGIGGIGKTTLLIEMAKVARYYAPRVLWLDGEVGLTTSWAFLTSLEMSLETEYGTKRDHGAALLPYLVSELSKQRTVLLIDNCENMDSLEGWLLSSFLPKLQSANVLLICASRKKLSLKWKTNPYLGSRIKELPLQVFTRSQVYDYLAGAGFSAERKRDIAEMTEGHPLALALAVDFLLSPQGAEQSIWRELPSLLSAEFLRETASPSLYNVLTVLSLLPVADQGMLHALIEHALEDSDFNRLTALSFVRVTIHGVSLHHVVARLLREEFARKHPVQFQFVRSKVLHLLADRFQLADREMQMRLAAHALELFREFLPMTHAYASFASVLRPGKREPFRQGDLSSLHRFLAASLNRADWQSELVEAADYSALLEDIAFRFPEGLLVVRDDQGTPLAFSAGIWLHAESLPLLERYVPQCKVILSEEYAALSRLPKEMSDTLFVLLSAVDPEQSLYRAEELGALLMQQWLIDMASGLRGMVASGDGQLNALLSGLGFIELGKIAVSGDRELTHWELDFRQATFNKWVYRIIGQAETAVKPSLPYDGQTALMIDRNDMKSVLEYLFEPDLMAKLPVIRRFGTSPQKVRAAVLDILNDACLAEPLTQLEKELLLESYIRKQQNKNQLAAFFHMSRSTFYRHTRLAEKHLAFVLSQKLRS